MRASLERYSPKERIQRFFFKELDDRLRPVIPDVQVCESSALWLPVDRCGRITGRMDQAKSKVSITLAADVIEAVDRAVKRQVASSRSAVIEQWLRRASRLDAEAQLRQDTIAYYESLSEAEREEDAGISSAASKAARRLAIDR